MTTMLQKDLIMLASPFNYQTRSTAKVPPGFLKYVSQRSLAVIMFIALAVMASVGNKQSDSKKPGLGDTSSIPIPQGYDAVLLLNPSQLADNIVRFFKDAVNDSSLREYARQQGINVCDSLTASCPWERE
jgi:hypothetical protein